MGEDGASNDVNRWNKAKAKLEESKQLSCTCDEQLVVPQVDTAQVEHLVRTVYSMAPCYDSFM